MASLHGSWLVQPQGGYLFVWGEIWRPMTPAMSSQPDTVASHPMAMTQAELIDFLRSRSLFGESRSHSRSRANEKWHKKAIALPSQTLETGEPIYPVLSTKMLSEGADASTLSLHLWQVEGLCLDPLEAIQFLQALPLGSFKASDAYVGGDLRFWAQVSRWILDLLVRCKFLPTLHRQLDGTVVAAWQPLLDSGLDQARLEKFTQLMPSACRTYQHSEVNGKEKSNEQLTPDEPKELLLGFLGSAIDAQVRSGVGNSALPAVEPIVQEWLQALSTASHTLKAEPAAIGRLEAALQTWTSPVQDHLVAPVFASGELRTRQYQQNRFRTCFLLQPPVSGDENWSLEYALQATGDPEFLVDAETIWNHPLERLVFKGRTIEHHQETFLSGLGLAARLYPPVESSLHDRRPQSCRLTPVQVYEFIKAGAWRLKDSGLGVVMPPSLMPAEGENRHLGLKIRSSTTPGKGQSGLQSWLSFEWELAIGDRTISKQEFDRLIALQSPLVQVNGEWIALQPSDVKAAQLLLATPKDQMALSLEDALRLSTGDTKVIEKLPVVSFEAAGPLQQLLTTLTNNQAVEAIAPPANFQGQLRPYQARGVGWLSFLERWGLGACLADDMGLGKCVSKDTLICVNGMLRTAEEIWKTNAVETEFDGEGFWAVPTESLLVNAINEETGRIGLAPIRRLYRQRVRETLRTLRLQDGSSITITYRHQLLTNQGWTNDLQVGNYVCVPAKMLWDGQPEDADLVKFLAWQIAEGYEQGDWGVFTISQKDTERLEELLETFKRIGQRYNLKINHPGICPNPGKVPFLRGSSQAYRQFLEAKGYLWGKRSRDKSIPPFIMQADLESVRIFLRNYFDAESAVVLSMRSIEIATASPLLIQQLSSLLRRFGIWLRVAPKQKRATNGSGIFRTYYIGTIGGNSARRFLQEIGFTNPDKQQKLEKICEPVSNTNIEGIPASDIVAQTVEATRLPVRHLGMHNTVYINGSQQFSRSSLERVVAGIEQILTGVAEQEYRQQKPSKWTTQTLEAYAQLNTQQLSVTRQQLQCLLDREVFFCQIQAIEDVDYDGWVYDFEVSEHHNFVANNILCHNTIQTIAFLLNLQEEEKLEAPTLLVCPTSVLGNWEREVKKFGPTLKVVVHHGDKRPKGKALAKAVKGKDLVITSYSLAFRDAKDLQSVSWRGVVLDEAQNIKNPQAKQSQAVRQLKAGFRIALTGTPVENRLAELWSILDFLNPGYLGTRDFFQRRFALPIEKYGDVASLQTLRSLVSPFILRRLKSDRNIIQDLPEKQEMTVFCGLSAEQAALYQKLVEESLVEIEASEGVQRKGIILALLIKLKQICNHPAQYLKEKELVAQRRSGKLQRLEEMLEEALLEGDRALIFTQFAEWGKLLQPYLEKQRGWETLFLYGGTRKQQREEMIDRFQNDPEGPRIFILSLKAGGTGLNLTRANHVFHFDRWWNPAVENQATDRVFRIGQTRNVQVHKFTCTGTLEERINEMIESKKALAEQVVGAGEQWITELNTDQLRNLLLLDRTAVIDDE
ncbi:MAG: SNF2-related protein [Cyanobacteriota bacterium]